ncbi:MAG TPA: HD domain-containing protein [Solirubrobacteraceae bacterium]|nr:HD domain-containing protein [Solirubrobacteraceae bacterium]
MQPDNSRADAWDLLCEWTQSDSLRRHMLAVEAAMRTYAPRFDGDPDLWGLTGLLHDLDYERYPDLGDGHPRYALRELEARGYPPELVRAVASHADFMGVPRETPMEKALFAVDELSGFILACAYVRPEGLVGMTPKSVKKKFKQPSFAAAVSRDDMREGAEGLGVDFDEHLTIVIGALTERRDVLMPAAGDGDSGGSDDSRDPGDSGDSRDSADSDDSRDSGDSRADGGAPTGEAPASRAPAAGASADA